MTSAAFDVLGIGNAIVDVLSRADDAFLSKHGLVKDPASYAVVEKRIRDCCAELGLQVEAWFDSAITGGDGNREFFIHAKQAGGKA